MYISLFLSKFAPNLVNMLSVVLFVSGGEIFIIMLAILIFFGADKIPEFARMMGKGVREFKKATDDIKRELHESSSGIMDDIKSIGNDMSSIGDDMTSIGNDMTDSFSKDIAEPLQASANEAEKTFDEYRDQYNADYYYDHQYDMGNHGNEYREETQTSEKTANEFREEVENIAENSAETTDRGQQPENTSVAEPADDTTKPIEA